ncbi:MAG: glutamine-hydrolyzing carbamoyl-phosphate synthase small subunit [Acutalibacteraceae bacterium]|nr:glutamine-hydrolyzing carbamoyl-phosphate synthase small subunit [Acutalibacteraceae bacterium]
MELEFNRKLILEDGSEYLGYAFGDESDKITEIVFNTSCVGYQEIISDPSYTYQTVVMAYPLIGNYGIAEDDFETETPTIGGLVVRDYNNIPSNFRSIKTLSEIMREHHIPGIYGVDTRMLVRSIRDLGSRMALITDINTTAEEGIRRIREFVVPNDAVSKVSRKSIVEYNVPDAKYHVVAIDCGMKQNIVRGLNNKKCNVTAVPWDTTAEALEALSPDGIFISNGPGDPTDAVPVIDLVKKLHGKYPIFGICLGHQIISLSYGAKTYKLKFGHRGGNHPVKNLKNGKIEITSQNHSYAVDTLSLDNTPLSITHINILDNTVEGVECKTDKIFSVQYHPESAPGPQDSAYLFDRFIDLMEDEKNAKKN